MKDQAALAPGTGIASSNRMKLSHERPSGQRARTASAFGQSFHRLATWVSQSCGSPWAFASASIVVACWAVIGPFVHFDETWQLVINTATTIVTFLMVFLLQATQNRDARAIHLKLDELIRTSSARDIFAHLEHGSDEELARLEAEFRAFRKRRRRRSQPTPLSPAPRDRDSSSDVP